MRRPTSLHASLVLAHLSVLSCLAAPTPTGKQVKLEPKLEPKIDEDAKPYLNQNTHHDGKYDVVHLSKGKPGDNQVLHALTMDPNVGEIHHVFTAIDNPDAAHTNFEHYMHRHAVKPKTIHVYKTPNHLHEVEHHEAVFDTLNEDKTAVKKERPLLDFEKDLGSKLREGKQVWVHSSGPTSLDHIRHIAKVTKAKNNHLLPMSLSVGHNSQQYHPDPNQKLPMQGRYLTTAQKEHRGVHPSGSIRWHNSRKSFQGTHEHSINRPADETVDLFHPTTQEQAKKDIFFGPTIEKINEHLHSFKRKGAIPADYHIPDPHPPPFKKANIDLREAVGEMLTTKDKKGKQLERVVEGRETFKDFLHAAPDAMRKALTSGHLTGDDARGTQKRLDRIDTNHFRAKFAGDDHYPVEMADPIALAAHRQAHHNKDKENGPQYKPIHFELKGQAYIGRVAKQGEEIHGHGLFHANAHEAFADHKHLVKDGKDVAYIPGSGHYPKDHPESEP